MHVHSYYSGDSTMTFKCISDEASADKIDAVILTDHAFGKVEYGLPPLRNLFKFSYSRASLLTMGPDKFINDIAAMGKACKDTIFIPGAEVTAHYYWSGNPFTAQLTLNQWHKHLLVIGLDDPEDYRYIPITGNGPADNFDPLKLWPLFIILSALLIKTHRRIRILLTLFGILLLANSYPFRKTHFDIYSPKAGEKPYQRLIDYADQKGALTFWAHPDAKNWEDTAPAGRLVLNTRNYPDSLLNTSGYTGFAVFSEGYRSAGTAGGYWDKALLQYCENKRSNPVWAVAELDYGVDSFKLNELLNILWVKEKSKQAVLQALKNGNFYAVFRMRSWGITLDDFYASTDNKRKYIPGETIRMHKDVPVTLAMSINSSDKKARNFKVSIIRDGAVISAFHRASPSLVVFTDNDKLSPGKHYYRVMVEEAYPHAIAVNPVFIEKI